MSYLTTIWGTPGSTAAAQPTTVTVEVVAATLTQQTTTTVEVVAATLTGNLTSAR